MVKKPGDGHHEVQESKEEVSPVQKQRPPEQRGIDKIIVDCKGLKLIFINDRDNNFLPIVSLNSSPFRILSCWNHEKSLIQAGFVLSMNFFNVNIGLWEPFIEKFSLDILSNQDFLEKVQNIHIDMPTSVNLNFTEKLIENLNESQKSWKICQGDYKRFEKSATEQHEESLRGKELEYRVLDFAQSTVVKEAPLSIVDLNLRNKIGSKEEADQIRRGSKTKEQPS